jgi:osmoprotectant transport system ATP-binding protein
MLGPRAGHRLSSLPALLLDTLPDEATPVPQDDPGMPAIRMRGVTKRFDGSSTDAVRDLDLDIERGSIVALIGPSGCGKTTTLRMINRLIEPTSGLIELEGADVTKQPAVELRRGIGYVIQQVGLFPHRTIGANIGTVPRSLGWDKARIEHRVDELAEVVGIDRSMLRRYPDELSGGQQQRVGVARALAADPPVLLMDEPFGAVDPIVRGRLQDELLGLQQRLHKTIVLVTHDLDEAVKVADRIALLNVGGVVEQYATPDELLRAPANDFVERFVGEDRSLRRLGLATVADLPYDPGPVVAASADPAEALAAADAHGSAWVGLVDDGVFLGWVTVDTITPDARLRDLERFLPAAQVQLTSTLLSALEVIMNSRTSVAVVQDDGRFKGVVTLERIRAGLAAHDDPEPGERAA